MSVAVRAAILPLLTAVWIVVAYIFESGASPLAAPRALVAAIAVAAVLYGLSALATRDPRFASCVATCCYSLPGLRWRWPLRSRASQRSSSWHESSSAAAAGRSHGARSPRGDGPGGGPANNGNGHVRHRWRWSRLPRRFPTRRPEHADRSRVVGPKRRRSAEHLRRSVGRISPRRHCPRPAASRRRRLPVGSPRDGLLDRGRQSVQLSTHATVVEFDVPDAAAQRRARPRTCLERRWVPVRLPKRHQRWPCTRYAASARLSGLCNQPGLRGRRTAPGERLSGPWHAELIERALLARNGLAMVVQTLWPSFVGDQSRAKVEGGYRALEALSELPTGPRFAFVHIPIPHQPNLYGPNGEARDVPLQAYGTMDNMDVGSDDYIRDYQGQLRYVAQQDDQGDSHRRRLRPRSGVVVMSDHGSGSARSD